MRVFSSLIGMTACLAALLLFIACDSGNGVTAVEAAMEPGFSVESSTFAVTSSTLALQSGAAARARAVRTSDESPVRVRWSSNNAMTGLTPTYPSSNAAVASVSRTGLVKAVAAGQATMTATVSGKSATSAVTVNAPVNPVGDTGTFFVSTTGSNANPGTKSAPWRTIAYGMTRLQPGQTLYVRGGTYRENIRSPSIREGRADARIRVVAYPGERPILQGLLWLSRPMYWTFDGINVTWATGNLQTEHMVKMTNGVGWIFENAELWGARSFGGLLVYGSIAGEPADWVIRGNCVHDVRTDPIHHINGDHNLYINTGTSAGAGLIERNILFNAPNGQNIKLGYGRSTPKPGDGTANVTVRYNTMVGALKNLMLTDESHNNIIERNIIVSSSEGYALRAYRLTGTNNIFRNNVFFDFDRLQYGDAGYKLATDGGGNLFSRDPKFDSRTCASFKPTDLTSQRYGRYGR